MAEAEAVPADEACEFFPVGKQAPDEIKIGLLEFTQPGGVGRPLVHLAVDVQEIAAHPRRPQFRIPQSLQPAWKLARPGMDNRAEAAELEELFQQVRVLPPLLDAFQPLGGGHGGNLRRGVPQVHLAAQHEAGKIIFRFPGKFLPPHFFRLLQETVVLVCQASRERGLRFPQVVIRGGGGKHQHLPGRIQNNLLLPAGDGGAGRQNDYPVFKPGSAIASLSLQHPSVRPRGNAG